MSTAFDSVLSGLLTFNVSLSYPRHIAGDTGGRELSSREREVLQLLAEGKSMKEVAALLEISPRTVEFHKYRIMGLLGVKTNAELVQYAIKWGLIVP